jgi:hypothetical protein
MELCPWEACSHSDTQRSVLASPEPHETLGAAAPVSRQSSWQRGVLFGVDVTVPRCEVKKSRDSEAFPGRLPAGHGQPVLSGDLSF